MNKAPLVSIIILSWNRKEQLRETLRHVFTINYAPYEVIVVDNASSDGSSEMVNVEFPQARLVALKDNLGIAGWNEGFSWASGEYFLVLDDDSYPLPNALRRGVSILEKRKTIAVLACHVLNSASNKSENWWRIGNDGRKSADEIAFVGAGAILRSSVVKQIGGFSSDFFLYQHEIEFGTRVLAHGLSIVLVKDVIVIHRASPLHRAAARRVFFQARNTIWYFLEFFSYFTAAWKTVTIVLHLFSDALRIGELSLAFRAIGSAVGGIRKILSQRVRVDGALQERILRTWPKPSTHVQRDLTIEEALQLDAETN